MKKNSFLMVQEKNNQEIDLMFKLRTLQQSMELEELEHKATKARLADKNRIDQSIEEANSEALRGETGTSIETKGHGNGSVMVVQLPLHLTIISK